MREQSSQRLALRSVDFGSWLSALGLESNPSAADLLIVELSAAEFSKRVFETSPHPAKETASVVTVGRCPAELPVGHSRAFKVSFLEFSFLF